MSENGEIYTAGKNFTLPPAGTGGTNLTSALESQKSTKLKIQEMALLLKNHSGKPHETLVTLSLNPFFKDFSHAFLLSTEKTARLLFRTLIMVLLFPLTELFQLVSSFFSLPFSSMDQTRFSK